MREAEGRGQREQERARPAGERGRSFSSYASCPPLSTYHRDVRVERRRRVGAHPHVEGFRVLYYLAHLRAPVAELGRAEREGDRLRLTGIEGQTLEPLQLAQRTRVAAGLLMNVELHHLVARDRAGVGHVGCHGPPTPPLHLRSCSLQVRDREGG